MHLSKEVLRELIEKQALVSNLSDINSQLTANGVDVRIAGIVEITNGGRLAINKTDNLAPKLGTGVVLRGFENRLAAYEIKDLQAVDNGVVKIDRLKPYLVITCEEVNTPDNLMFTILPRSSLFRLTQSVLGCGFGEAGYKGFLTFMLLSFSDAQIELGSRFAQLSFSELKGSAHYEQQNESSYQGGKLF